MLSNSQQHVFSSSEAPDSASSLLQDSDRSAWHVDTLPVPRPGHASPEVSFGSFEGRSHSASPQTGSPCAATAHGCDAMVWDCDVEARGWGHSPEVSFGSVGDEQILPSQGFGEEGDASTEALREAAGDCHASLSAEESTDIERDPGVARALEQQQGQEAAALPNSHRGAADSYPLLQDGEEERGQGQEGKHEHAQQGPGKGVGLPSSSPDRFQQFMHTRGAAARALAQRGVPRVSRSDKGQSAHAQEKKGGAARSSAREQPGRAVDAASGTPADLVRSRLLAGSSRAWAVSGGNDTWQYVVQARGPTGYQVPVVLALAAMPAPPTVPGRRVIQRKMTGLGKRRGRATQAGGLEHPQGPHARGKQPPDFSESPSQAVPEAPPLSTGSPVQTVPALSLVPQAVAPEHSALPGHAASPVQVGSAIPAMPAAQVSAKGALVQKKLYRDASKQGTAAEKCRGAAHRDPASASAQEWVPPVSPYGLIQEKLYKDPWKLLVACMLLNKTSGQQV